MGRPFPKSHLLWQVNGAGMAWRGNASTAIRALRDGALAIERARKLAKKAPLRNATFSVFLGTPEEAAEFIAKHASLHKTQAGSKLDRQAKGAL